MSFEDCTESFKNGTTLRLYVRPDASKSGPAGLFGDQPRLKLKVNSPPVDGEANAEVLRYVAQIFKLKKIDVVLLRGERSRQKDIWVPLSQEVVVKLLTNVWQSVP